ncbi:MAG: phosphotransferase [Candidatus Dormibacteria bacterium]
MRTEPGALLAVGREADVFDAGNGRVLRRYRHRAVMDQEVVAMRWARGHGYPAPEVVDVDGADMLMERVGEATMLTDLGRRPWLILAHADRLASLHQQLHSIPAPPDLTLQAPTGGDDFLHLDLHPENVMVGSDGPWVIDWAGARRGHAADDVAYSWIIMATSDIPGDALTRAIAAVGRRSFMSRFLSHFSRDEVLAQLAAVGEQRLEDRNVTETEGARVRRLVQRALAGHAR